MPAVGGPKGGLVGFNVFHVFYFSGSVYAVVRPRLRMDGGQLINVLDKENNALPLLQASRVWVQNKVDESKHEIHSQVDAITAGTASVVNLTAGKWLPAGPAVRQVEARGLRRWIVVAAISAASPCYHHCHPPRALSLHL